MTAAKNAPQSREKIPLNTYLLSLGQAINLTAAVLSVTIAALVGTKLAPSPILATVPYGAQFAGVMICTYPASFFMRLMGRRAGFTLAGSILLLAGGIGYIAIVQSQFALLVIAHVLIGVYVSFANYYRFAAVDNLSKELRPRGLSLVVAGGVVAAILGPFIADELRVILNYPEFSLCYAAFGGLGIITLVLMLFWKPAKHLQRLSTSFIPKKENIALSPLALTAILASSTGYMLMNLFMVQSCLVMNGMSISFEKSASAVQIHVIAMFAPSFFTGTLVRRVGPRMALIAGFLLLAASNFYGTFALGYSSIVIGLILLGLGWNLTYIGGSSLLAEQIPEAGRYRWQGINDTAIAICATIGAALPSVLESTIGWSTSNFIGIFICFLLIVFCWFSLSTSNFSKYGNTVQESGA